jgi:transposase-like protein
MLERSFMPTITDDDKRGDRRAARRSVNEEEIAGPGGLLAQLTKRLVERAMEVELTDHLGYEPHQEPPGGPGTQRNGTTPKTLITEHGPVAIDDAEGSRRQL